MTMNKVSANRFPDGMSVYKPFQIPVFVWEAEETDLNRQLRETVLDRYEKMEGMDASNRGGWQSPYTLHRWEEPGIDPLLGKIDTLLNYAIDSTVEDPDSDHFEDWLIEAWGNVNVRGASNVSHSHGTPDRPALWSGVYYVEPGRSSEEENVGGETVFEDRIGVPREVLNDQDPFSHDLTVEPRPGSMLLFPSTLRHRVEPYLGDELRITIAFNLYHPGFVIPRHADYADDVLEKVYGSRALWHAKMLLNALTRAVRRPSVVLDKLRSRNGHADGDAASDDPDSLLDVLRKREDRKVGQLKSQNAHSG